jgi:hypothetical protein
MPVKPSPSSCCSPFAERAPRPLPRRHSIPPLHGHQITIIFLANHEVMDLHNTAETRPKLLSGSKVIAFFV